MSVIPFVPSKGKWDANKLENDGQTHMLFDIQRNIKEINVIRINNRLKYNFFFHKFQVYFKLKFVFLNPLN